MRAEVVTQIAALFEDALAVTRSAAIDKLDALCFQIPYLDRPMPLTRSVDKGSRLEFKDLTNALTGI